MSEIWSLVRRLEVDYPDFVFKKGRRFFFRPPKTITMNIEENKGDLLLLHELGHAICGHWTFKTAPERIKCERAAWEKARELCRIYGVNYDEEFVELELDSYRDWLDKKSRCPFCGLTRSQTPDGNFHCPKCENY